MGIHGIFKEIGPGQRIALAKVAADHYIAHNRPFRLAIDISIWLFQIQAGKGGSNPALRTFYYRLLRLLSLSIHPLFVFDGPNKPLFKRNKRVGGPGVRVATVPEFLAKQLLKQFGFPLHVAPGEAEAECALLQREGIVDAVLSEDVDTIMFGSGITMKSWTSENSGKTPTHVNVYKAETTKETSGLDREGMILVALMSGGDYIPEGIPGCGPKVACDAARAGFGKDLCRLGKKDAAGLAAWKERLQHEIRTNESKFFSRKSSVLVIPEDFPNFEVMGYYTRPCVSSPEKLAKLRESLRWDQEINYAELRDFTADAFDWRCLGGAKKFIKNLAPAVLVRDLRLRSERNVQSSQTDHESVREIHGKRNHNTTDGILEYRISFQPSELVPIDLSIEEEDDQINAGGMDDSDADSDGVGATSTQAGAVDSEVPQSPSKKRVFKPYDPDAPDKLWVMAVCLQLGCPLKLEDYEASLRDPIALLKQRRKAKEATAKRGTKSTKEPPQQNTLLRYAKITKSTASSARDALQELETAKNQSLFPSASQPEPHRSGTFFKLPLTQLPAAGRGMSKISEARSTSQKDMEPSLPNMALSDGPPKAQRTPRRKKRPSPALNSPISTQQTLEASFSASSRRVRPPKELETINLISSSPVAPDSPSRSATPLQLRQQCPVSGNLEQFSPRELPDTVTKRRRKAPLKRWQTEPVRSTSLEDNLELCHPLDQPLDSPSEHTPLPTHRTSSEGVESIDLISPSSPKSGGDFPSPSAFFRRCSARDSPLSGKAGQDLDVYTAPIPFQQPTIPQRRTTSPPIGHFESQPRLVTAKNNDLSAIDNPELPRNIDLADKSLPSQPKIPDPSSKKATAKTKKTHIQLRQSLAGAWREVDLDSEMLDLTGDGSGYKASIGKPAEISAGRGKPRAAPATAAATRSAGIGKGSAAPRTEMWRKSGVDVLDLTGDL